MKKLLVAAAVAGLVGTVNAQSAFEGAYGQLGIGYENNSINSYTLQVDNFPLSINSANAGSFSGVIGLGYNFQVAKEFLLGIGADYGMVPSSTFNSQIGGGDTLGNKVSNRYNIFLTPGYVIDKDKLAYLKVGYSSQSLKITDTGPGSDTNGQTVGSGNVNGYVLGLGYKQMVQSGFYGFAEANYYSYSALKSGTNTLTSTEVVTNVNPKSSAYQFLIGVGYKF
jgi:outer membrane immunogenic protein